MRDLLSQGNISINWFISQMNFYICFILYIKDKGKLNRRVKTTSRHGVQIFFLTLVFKKEVKRCGIEDMSGHVSKTRGRLTKSWCYFAKTSQIHVRSHIKSKGKVDQVLVLFCKRLLRFIDCYWRGCCVEVQNTPAIKEKKKIKVAQISLQLPWRAS